MAFIGGMFVVPLVIPFQQYVYAQYFANPVTMYILFAGIEEIWKFIGAYFTGLKSRDNDEPVDPMIYLLTTALGFAALENALYILNPLTVGDFTETIITGNFRFIGATLLHVVCSTTIGVFLGYAFYQSRKAKVLAVIAGLGIATALHALFNLIIMKTNGGQTFAVFYFVWMAIVLLALFFERMKRMPSERSVQVAALIHSQTTIQLQEVPVQSSVQSVEIER